LMVCLVCLVASAGVPCVTAWISVIFCDRGRLSMIYQDVRRISGFLKIS
jgi:hypothetical protein